MITMWVNEAGQVMRALIGSVESPAEYNVLLAAAALGFVFALFNISAAMGSTMSTVPRVLGVAVLGGYLLMITVVAARLYLVPNLHAVPMLPWLPWIAAGLVLLALVAPIAKVLLSSGYFEAVLSVVLSIAAAALVVILVQAGFNAFREGDKGFNKTNRRRNIINNMIDDT